MTRAGDHQGGLDDGLWDVWDFLGCQEDAWDFGLIILDQLQ
jgi:hypothetical protein